MRCVRDPSDNKFPSPIQVTGANDGVRIIDEQHKN